MTKMSLLMIMTPVLALTFTGALAGNPDPVATKTKLNGLSGLQAGIERKTDDCRTKDPKLAASTQAPIPGLEPSPGASGCLLSEGPKQGTEPGEIYQIDSQVDYVQIHGS